MLYKVFIDLKKTYNKISREVLWWVMTKDTPKNTIIKEGLGSPRRKKKY